MARSVEGRISAMWNTIPSAAGQCAHVVWQSLDVPALGAATAAIAARIVASRGYMRHAAPGDVPRGGVMYWTGGSRGAGHMALSLGGGMVLSTDVAGPATVGSVTAGWFASHWTALKWVGWSSWYSEPLPMTAGAPETIPKDSFGNEIAGSAPADGSMARITAAGVEWVHIAGWQPIGGGSGFVTDHPTAPMMWLQDGFRVCAFQDTSKGRSNPMIQTFTPASDVLVCRIAPPRNRYRAPSLWWFVKEKVSKDGSQFTLAVYEAKWKRDARTKRVQFDKDWRKKANRIGTLRGLTMKPGSMGTVFVDRRRNDAYEVMLSGIWARVGKTQGGSFVLTEGGFHLVGVVPEAPAIALKMPGGSAAMDMVGAGGGGTLPSKPGVQPRDLAGFAEDRGVRYVFEADGKEYDLIYILGAMPSGHTVLIYARENLDSSKFAILEVENLASLVYRVVDWWEYPAAPVVRVVKPSSTANRMDRFAIPKQSASGEICWLSSLYGSDWKLNVYRPKTGDVDVFTVGRGSYTVVGTPRVASTGGYLHVDFMGTDYHRWVVCFSLATGDEEWSYELLGHSITSILEGSYTRNLYPWEYLGDKDAWRQNYRYIAAVDKNRHIINNTSPDTVSVSAKVVIRGLTPFDPPNPLYPWPEYGYWTQSNTATWDVTLVETGETRTNTAISSGAAIYYSTVWSFNAQGYWIDPIPPVGYYTVAGYTSTKMNYLYSDNYYDVSNTTIWGVSVNEPHAGHVGTGTFSVTGSSNTYLAAASSYGYWWYGYFGWYGYYGWGYGYYAHPGFSMYVNWDNTRFNGNRLELRNSSGTVLDTLPFPNAGEASFIAYDNNEIFVGAPLINPWTGEQPETPTFFWRKIIVDGNSMSYTPVCSFKLPSHFNWSDLRDYPDPDDPIAYREPVEGVTLGVWEGQVVVHALGFVGGCST